MSNLYKKFYFQSDIDNLLNFLPGLGFGCGVTAIDYNDAIIIINKKKFFEIKMPAIKKVIENIDISILHLGHITPNMKPPNYEGIWFPMGYH